MEIITDCTHPKLFKPSWRRLFLFVTSIARTNLESEIVQRGGSLCFVTSIARTNLESEIIQRGGSLCSSNVLRYKPRQECLG